MQTSQSQNTKPAHHIIHFYGPINAISILELNNTILNTVYQCGAKHITLSLSSNGGDLVSGFTAYNLIRSLPVEVTTINMGSVESIAMMIYLAGNKRLCHPNSRFLIHSFNWSADPGAVDYNRLSERSDLLGFDINRYLSIFNERTKNAERPIDAAKHLHGSALIIDPATAITSGISTDVLSSDWTLPANGTVVWWISNIR